MKKKHKKKLKPTVIKKDEKKIDPFFTKRGNIKSTSSSFTQFNQ